MRIAGLLASLIVGLMLGGVPASAGSSVALVIGNSAYQNVSLLLNLVNDATDMSVSLRRLNFSGSKPIVAQPRPIDL